MTGRMAASGQCVHVVCAKRQRSNTPNCCYGISPFTQSKPHTLQNNNPKQKTHTSPGARARTHTHTVNTESQSTKTVHTRHYTT